MNNHDEENARTDNQNHDDNRRESMAHRADNRAEAASMEIAGVNNNNNNVDGNDHQQQQDVPPPVEPHPPQNRNGQNEPPQQRNNPDDNIDNNIVFLIRRREMMVRPNQINNNNANAENAAGEGDDDNNNMQGDANGPHFVVVAPPPPRQPAGAAARRQGEEGQAGGAAENNGNDNGDDQEHRLRMAWLGQQRRRALAFVRAVVEEDQPEGHAQREQQQQQQQQGEAQAPQQPAQPGPAIVVRPRPVIPPAVGQGVAAAADRNNNQPNPIVAGRGVVHAVPFLGQPHPGERGVRPGDAAAGDNNNQPNPIAAGRGVVRVIPFLGARRPGERGRPRLHPQVPEAAVGGDRGPDAVLAPQIMARRQGPWAVPFEFPLAGNDNAQHPTNRANAQRQTMSALTLHAIRRVWNESCRHGNTVLEFGGGDEITIERGLAEGGWGPVPTITRSTSTGTKVKKAVLAAVLKKVVQLGRKYKRRPYPFHVILRRCNFSNGAAAQMGDFLEFVSPTVVEILDTTRTSNSNNRNDNGNDNDMSNRRRRLGDRFFLEEDNIRDEEDDDDDDNDIWRVDSVNPYWHRPPPPRWTSSFMEAPEDEDDDDDFILMGAAGRRGGRDWNLINRLQRRRIARRRLERMRVAREVVLAIRRQEMQEQQRAQRQGGGDVNAAGDVDNNANDNNNQNADGNAPARRIVVVAMEHDGELGGGMPNVLFPQFLNERGNPRNNNNENNNAEAVPGPNDDNNNNENNRRNPGDPAAAVAAAVARAVAASRARERRPRPRNQDGNANDRAAGDAAPALPNNNNDNRRAAEHQPLPDPDVLAADALAADGPGRREAGIQVLHLPVGNEGDENRPGREPNAVPVDPIPDVLEAAFGAVQNWRRPAELPLPPDLPPPPPPPPRADPPGHYENENNGNTNGGSIGHNNDGNRHNVDRGRANVNDINRSTSRNSGQNEGSNGNTNNQNTNNNPNNDSNNATKVFSHDTLVALLTGLMPSAIPQSFSSRNNANYPARRGLEALRLKGLGLRNEGAMRLLCCVLRHHGATLSTLCLNACRFNGRSIIQLARTFLQLQPPPGAAGVLKAAALQHFSLHNSAWINDSMMRMLLMAMHKGVSQNASNDSSRSTRGSSSSTAGCGTLQNLKSLVLVDNPLITAVGVLPNITSFLCLPHCNLEELRVSVGLRQPTKQEVLGKPPPATVAKSLGRTTTTAATSSTQMPESDAALRPSASAGVRNNIQDEEQSDAAVDDDDEEDDDDDEDANTLLSTATTFSMMPVIDLDVRHGAIFSSFGASLRQNKTLRRLYLDTPFSGRRQEHERNQTMGRRGDASSAFSTKSVAPAPEILVTLLQDGNKTVSLEEMRLFQMLVWRRRRQSQQQSSSNATSSKLAQKEAQHPLDKGLQESMSPTSTSLVVHRLYSSGEKNKSLFQGIASLSLDSLTFRTCCLSRETAVENKQGEESDKKQGKRLKMNYEEDIDDDRKPSALMSTEKLVSRSEDWIFSESDLKKLHLNRVEGIPFRSLLHPLSSNLVELRVTNCEMNDVQLKELLLRSSAGPVASAPPIPVAASKDWKDNDDTQEMQALHVDSTSVGKETKLRILCLSNNYLTISSLGPIAQFLDSNPQLRTLVLSHNRSLLLSSNQNEAISGVEARRKANGEIRQLEKFLEVLKGHSMIENLDMLDCGLTHVSNGVLMGPLLCEFDSNPTRRNLRMNSASLCQLSGGGRRGESSNTDTGKDFLGMFLQPYSFPMDESYRLADEVASMRNIKSVMLEYESEREWHQNRLDLMSSVLSPAFGIQALTINFSQIRNLNGNRVLTFLTAGLRDHKTLKTLRLSGPYITDRALTTLVEILTSPTAPLLDCLKFRRNLLTPQSLPLIVQLLRHQTKLISFEIASCALLHLVTDSERIQPLADSIALHGTLRDLSIRECRLSGVALAGIFKELERPDANIENLDIDGFVLPEANDWIWTAHVPRLSPNLRHVCLTKNIWAWEKWAGFVKELQANTSICSIQYHAIPHHYRFPRSDYVSQTANQNKCDDETAIYDRDVPDPLVNEIVRRNRYLNLVNVMTGDDISFDRANDHSISVSSTTSNLSANLLPLVLEKFGSNNGEGSPLFHFLRSGIPTSLSTFLSNSDTGVKRKRVNNGTSNGGDGTGTPPRKRVRLDGAGLR